MRSIRTTISCYLFSGFVAILMCSHSLAADPELVGILADAVDPQVAQQIGLDDRQLRKIEELISQQESNALNLADQMRDLPPQDRAELLNNSIKTLEAKAFAVLRAEQRSQLERVRINRLGLKSLNEAQVAETLGLSDGQADQIQQVLASRIQVLRDFGRDKAEDEMQRRLRRVLTDSQFRLWQAMAGTTSDIGASEKTAANQRSANQQAAQNAAPLADATITTEVPSKDATDSASSMMAIQNSADKAADQTNSEMTAPIPDAPQVAAASGDSQMLSLNFTANDWSSVLKWIATEAELSLQVDTMPPGTFTYRDPYRKYSVAESLDIMNGVLLGKGFTLVRRQRTLMVIDLGSGESAEVTRGLIRELAQLVAPEQLNDRGDFELLKCLFLLSRMTAEDAQTQIKQLIGPQGSVVAMPAAGQILVTETGANLRLIRDMIERVENPDSSRTMRIATLSLQNVTAEEVLSIARPLLGLPEDSNTAEGINLSTDTFGNTIYATGSNDKLQLLRDIIAKVDTAPGENNPAAVAIEQPTFRSHRILSSDPDLAMDVLQTLLAGTPNVRLALDSKTSSIVASATPTDHMLIDQTLAELAGQSNQFTIIPLNRIDPQSAITTLERFFGKPAAATATDAKAAVPNAGPIFYGDAFARTLMVRGSKQQIEQVQEIISKIEESGPSMDLLGDKVKVLPTTGKTADRLIEQMQLMWAAQNKNARIRVRNAGQDSARNDSPRRAVLGDANRMVDEQAKPASNSVQQNDEPKSASEQSDAPKRQPSSSNRQPSANSNQSEKKFRYVQTNADELDESEAIPEINIIRSPNGLIVTSNDPKLLAEFEQMALLLSDQMDSAVTEPTIFYLKFVPAASAAELLNQILSGKSASGGGGGLMGSMASSLLGEVGGGLVGGLLGGGGGSLTSSGPGIASGATSIVADPRLNYLLVQANESDLQLIEQLINVIDQEDSPLQIETKGRPRIIPVVYSDATEIAKIVKEVFADRMTQAAGGGGGGGGGRQPSPQDFIEALRGGGRGGNGGGGGAAAAPMKEATMTVGVDTRNNAIIVTGSNSLYLQVKELVELLDQGSEETQQAVQVVKLGGNLNASVMQGAIQSILGSQAKVKTSTDTAAPATSGGSSSSASGASNTPAAGNTPSPEDLQRRIEFFRSLRGGGGAPSGQGGGGFGSGGGFGGGGRGQGGGGRGQGGGGRGQRGQ